MTLKIKELERQIQEKQLQSSIKNHRSRQTANRTDGELCSSSSDTEANIKQMRKKRKSKKRRNGYKGVSNHYGIIINQIVVQNKSNKTAKHIPENLSRCRWLHQQDDRDIPHRHTSYEGRNIWEENNRPKNFILFRSPTTLLNFGTP